MSKTGIPSWFKDYLLTYKRAVAIAIGLGLVASGCAALLMFTSGYLISATALAGTTLFSIMIPVGCVQLFGFGRPLARYLERLASHDWVLHVTSDLRLSLYRAVERRTGDPARARATGEYLGLLSDDVAHLQNLYLRVVFPSCIAYLLAIGCALLFGFFSVPFALVILLSLVVVVVLLPLGCLLATRATSQQAKTLKAEEYAQLTDDVYGALDWVLAGRNDEVVERHRADDGVIRSLEVKARMVQRACSFAATALLAVLLCAVIVWAGGRFTTPGSNVNWIIAFALGFFPLIESFAVLPVAFSESAVHRDSLQRLDQIMLADGHDGSGEVQASGRGAAGYAADDASDAGDESAVSRSLHAPAGANNGEAACGMRGAIVFDNVAYTYPGSSCPALHGFSFAVEADQSVAVLGRSGAGKTTLAALMRGMLSPDEGTIAVCGARVGRGVDLSRVVGYVGQAPYLFNRTLRDNLTLGVLQASDDRLKEVLHDVGLGERFATLDKGLDTIVGETGVGFSGGEAHRIALARVLVADTPIVVVDEPFSALDPKTELDVLDTLLRVCAGRTLVVITHHLAHIERFDRVVFIENGVVDLDGSPQNLLATSPRFRALVEFDRNEWQDCPATHSLEVIRVLSS